MVEDGIRKFAYSLYDTYLQAISYNESRAGLTPLSTKRHNPIRQAKKRAARWRPFMVIGPKLI